VQRQIQIDFYLLLSAMVYILLDCKTKKVEQGLIVGHSDPVMLCGKVIDQLIKGTLGITGL